MSDTLTHFGVRGMKWGVRKQQQLDNLERIGSGKGRVDEVVRIALTSTLKELETNNHDIAKVAAGRAAILRAQKARSEAGKSTTLDKIDFWMHTPISELMGRKK